MRLRERGTEEEEEDTGRRGRRGGGRRIGWKEGREGVRILRSE